MEEDFRGCSVSALDIRSYSDSPSYLVASEQSDSNISAYYMRTAPPLFCSVVFLWKRKEGRRCLAGFTMAKTADNAITGQTVWCVMSS